MKEVIFFIISFFFILSFYEMIIIKRSKKRVNKKTGKEKKRKEPLEVTYLVTRYQLDLEKVNYSNLLHVISIVSSFDIALIVSVISLLNNFFLEIIIGFLFTLGIILISYHLVYLYYKKKGMIKNES